MAQPRRKGQDTYTKQTGTTNLTSAQSIPGSACSSTLVVYYSKGSHPPFVMHSDLSRPTSLNARWRFDILPHESSTTTFVYSFKQDASIHILEIKSIPNTTQPALKTFLLLYSSTDQFLPKLRRSTCVGCRSPLSDDLAEPPPWFFHFSKQNNQANKGREKTPGRLSSGFFSGK